MRRQYGIEFAPFGFGRYRFVIRYPSKRDHAADASAGLACIMVKVDLEALRVGWDSRHGHVLTFEPIAFLAFRNLRDARRYVVRTVRDMKRKARGCRAWARELGEACDKSQALAYARDAYQLGAGELVWISERAADRAYCDRHDC